MKQSKIVTFLDSREFKKEYMGAERDFIELSFIEHRLDGKMSAYKCLTTKNKLNKALNYRGYSGLEKSKRYQLWLSDYKGNGKLTFSGIVLL